MSSANRVLVVNVGQSSGSMSTVDIHKYIINMIKDCNVGSGQLIKIDLIDKLVASTCNYVEKGGSVGRSSVRLIREVMEYLNNISDRVVGNFQTREQIKVRIQSHISTLDNLLNKETILMQEQRQQRHAQKPISASSGGYTLVNSNQEVNADQFDDSPQQIVEYISASDRSRMRTGFTALISLIQKELNDNIALSNETKKLLLAVLDTDNGKRYFHTALVRNIPDKDDCRKAIQTKLEQQGIKWDNYEPCSAKGWSIGNEYDGCASKYH